ncbi:MAG TPA: Kazal-type serine protease inhibitor family protein [bacterium]|nr:Kazal-type serine protease inhibitor family protein [bacterium]
MKKTFSVFFVVLLFLAACDEGSFQKPGPDNGIADKDQIGGNDDPLNDDDLFPSDDGQIITDDDGIITDDGQIVTDDDGTITDETKPDSDLPTGECAVNKDCETDFCQKATGACKEGTGSCAARPEGCPELYAPVCGCDEVTYDNECMAHAYGVNVLHEGECDSAPSCTTDQECGDFVAMLCQKATGVCENGAGTCVIPETGCDMMYAPVCGCDGNTYGNECEAHANFMNVAYEGECGGETKYSTISYYYDASTDEPPMASAVILNGDETVTFEGADLMTRTPFDGGVTITTTFYGPDGGGVINLQLTLYSNGFSLPYTVTLDGAENFAQWTNFSGGGPTQLLGDLNGEVTISQYQKNNSGTVVLVELAGNQLTFIPLPPQ